MVATAPERKLFWYAVISGNSVYITRAFKKHEQYKNTGIRIFEMLLILLEQV